MYDCVRAKIEFENKVMLLENTTRGKCIIRYLFNGGSNDHVYNKVYT